MFFLQIFRIGGHTLFSIIFGYILYVLFEAPSVNICKIAFKRNVRQTIKSSSITSDDPNNNNNESIELMDKKNSFRIKNNQCKLD